MNQTNDKSLNAYQKPVTLKNVILFTLPTIAMSLFMSFYTMVDGLFVSRLIGTNALSAINLTAPVISLVTAVSTMLATGGSAVIMKKMDGVIFPKQVQVPVQELKLTQEHWATQ